MRPPGVVFCSRILSGVLRIAPVLQQDLESSDPSDRALLSKILHFLLHLRRL